MHMLNINQVCGTGLWKAFDVCPIVCINVNGKDFDFHWGRISLLLGAGLNPLKENGAILMLAVLKCVKMAPLWGLFCPWPPC